MKPDDMRELFKDALTEPVSAAQAGTDDIVAAGRRRVRRRRVAQAGSASLTAVAAVALFALAPLVFTEGDAADATTDGTPDDVGPPVVPVEVCPSPSHEPTEDQVRIATMYDEALTEYITSIGGGVGDSCVQGEVNYDGFHYDEQFGGYRFAEGAVFPDSGERVTLEVDVHYPLYGDVEERLEELSRCEALDLTCDREEIPEGSLLLVEEQRRIVVDEDERPEGELVPFHSALLVVADRTIVQVQMGVDGGPGSLSTTPEQLGGLAAAIPVVYDVPYESPEETEEQVGPTDDELIADFVEAASSALGGSPFTSPDSIEFAAPGEDYHYGQDGTRVAAAEVTLDDGTRATLFLQVTPIDAPEDKAEDGIAAEHYAQCSYAADCEYSPLDETTDLVHRTVEAEGTELTSLELRSADGWVVGVGIVPDGPAAIDFATLDAIVAEIR